MSTVLEPKANTNYEIPIHDLLRRRRSPRAFSSEPIEHAKLVRLFEAARWAPSASNEQPWRFIIATHDSPDDFARILSSLKEGNRQWAQHAPALVISVAKWARDKDGHENRHAFHDVGQAVALLSVQALEEGLYLHQMGGFDGDIARDVLDIPEGYFPVAAIAIGYPGDPQTLPDALRDRELSARTRKPLSEIVFTGRWGQPFA